MPPNPSVRFPTQLPGQELTDPMPKTVILGAARTPFGKLGGALASLDATELGGQAISAALERAEVGADQVEHVVYGQGLQAGQGQTPFPPAPNQGRHPPKVPVRDLEKGGAARPAP